MVLSEQQKESVKESWKVASKTWLKDGPTYFLQLFHEQRKIFDKFNELLFMGKDIGEIPGSPELSAQSANFKGLVTNWIDSLDDHGTLGSHCATFAKNHKARKIPPDHIKIAFDYFVDFMVENYDADKTAWTEFVKILMGLIKPGME